MEGGQAVGSDADFGVNGHFDEPLLQLLSTPQRHVLRKGDPPLLVKQYHFLERDGRHGDLADVPRSVDLAPHKAPEASIPGGPLEQYVDVKQCHGTALRSGSVSASQATSTDPTMSPETWMRPLSIPKSVEGFVR